MRMLLKVSIPVQKGNQAVADGTLQRSLQRMAETLRPEATYSTAMDGKRTGLVIFDLADPSQIPVVAEPLFQALEAEIELYPLMTAEDVAKGLNAVAQQGR